MIGTFNVNNTTRNNSGENNPMFGNHHSKETKRKISIALKNKIPYNKGNRFNKKHHNKVCTICGKHFNSYVNKYCSKECVKIFRKTHSPNIYIDKNYGSKIIKCSFCGGEIKVKNSQFNKYTNHYCDNICKNKHASHVYVLDNNNNWKGGLSFEPYSIAFNKSLKESIRKRDNYKCQICEENSKQTRRTLCIHHIDYDKNNCYTKNLVSLCRKCHGKTNSNRKYWEWQLKILMSL